MDQNMLPCAGCKKLRVLKLGDYCRECAIEWHPRDDEYFVVTPKNLDEVVAITGAAKKYLNAKQEMAFENHRHYVVYCVNDEWKECFVSDGYHLSTVMANIFKRERQ